jgi:hypothetical protein
MDAGLAFLHRLFRQLGAERRMACGKRLAARTTRSAIRLSEEMLESC